MVDGLPLSAQARRAARAAGFDHSCSEGTARLLSRLAGDLPLGSRVGEVGTGFGVGTAALAATMPRDASLVSIECDPGRADAARDLLAADSRVTIITAKRQDLVGYGPFDLVFLDAGPKPSPHEVTSVLRIGGSAVIDDFTPTRVPGAPEYAGEPDLVRLAYLECPDLEYAEHRVSPTEAAVLLTRLR